MEPRGLNIQSLLTVWDIEVKIPHYNLILVMQKRTSEGHEA